MLNRRRAVHSDDDRLDEVSFLLHNWDNKVHLRNSRDGTPVARTKTWLAGHNFVLTFDAYIDLRSPGRAVEFFATSNGFLGLAAGPVGIDYHVVLIKGCKLNVVLRS